MGTEATSEPELGQRLLALLLEKGYDRDWVGSTYSPVVGRLDWGREWNLLEALRRALSSASPKEYLSWEKNTQMDPRWQDSLARSTLKRIKTGTASK